MKLYTFGDCHADTPWYHIKPSDIPPFTEINYNGIFSKTLAHVGIEEPPYAVDISGYYVRKHGKPVWDSNLRAELAKLTYPYNDYFNVSDGDAVVFSFGEIDCRTHLSLEMYSNMWKDLVDESIPRYFEKIKINVDKFNNLHVMIHNVIPQTSDERFKTFCPIYPREGIDVRRREISLYMNEKLKEYCKIYNYIFFDVYDKYCSEDGYINVKFSDGCTHINDPIYYIEFINNLKLGEL